jgi:hypothetical protein
MLIVCEGRETEANYFHGLWDEIMAKSGSRKGFALTIKRGRGGSRRDIAQFAVDQKNGSRDEYDEYHCIMDVEHHLHWAALPGALRLLKQNGFTVHLSNPSFEVWFLAHFRRTSAIFADADAVITALNPLWKAGGNGKYEKSDRAHFSKLRNRLVSAIATARAVRTKSHRPANATTENCNSSTDVYRFVERLVSPKKPPKKRKPKKRHKGK